MPDPSSSLLDNFNRASLDANWTQMYSGNWPSALAIVSSTLLAGSNASNYCGGYWNPATFGPNSEAWITCTDVGAQYDECSVFCRLQTPTTSGIDGYFFQRTYRAGDGADTWDLGYYANGSWNSIANGTRTFADGDGLWVQANGDLIKGFCKDGASAWVEVASVTDTTITGAGNVGVDVRRNSMRFDNFGGGDLVGATLEQLSHRWRDDDGSETGASWLAAQDAQLTRAKNVATRLRSLVDATGDPVAMVLRCEYRKKRTSKVDPWRIIS